MRTIKISFPIFAVSVYFTGVLSSFAFAQEAPKAAVAAVSAQEEQSSYVYDLKKLIEKSKDNIKRVNEKIQEQAIYKRNQQREEKAREYYERAIQLFEDGKTQEARDLWEKSIKITEHPEMKMYIKGSERRFKLQTEALRKEGLERQGRTVEDQKIREQQGQEAYVKAVALYKQKKFTQAREEFILVEQLIPEFKATRSYLKLLDQNIAVQEKESVKNQKKEIDRQQEGAEVARVREKEMWRKEINLKEQERRSKLTKQARDVYKEALDLYKKKDFVGAKEKFQEVEWVIPDYKSTRKYLDTLEADIKKHEAQFVSQKQKERAKQGWEEELSRKKLDADRKKEFESKSADQKHKDAQEAEMHYQSAVRLLSERKYQGARDKFREVQQISPEYKATESYLSRLNQKLGIIENAPAQASDDVKEVYADAVKAYKAKDYALAKLRFERVEFMYPNYEATRRYLSKLDKDYDIKKAVVTAAKDDAILREDRVDFPKKDLDPSVPEMQAPVFASVDKPVASEEYDQLVKKAEPLYEQALVLYEAKKFDESFKQFQSIEEMLPNYKSTRPYLKRVNQQIRKAEQLRYKEEQMAQAETINILAKQANSLFLKIQMLSDDSATSSAKRKFAMIDKLFANMSREQAKLLAEILEEEKKLKLEEIAYEQEVEKSEFANIIDPIYDEAVRLYKAKRYDDAKAKFLEAQSKLTDYRSSSRYLALIDKQNILLAQAMTDREEKIMDYHAKAERDAELQAKLELQTKEQNMIKQLVAQAEAINDEIMTLSKDRNFEVIKAKFAELEKVVDNLLTIKSAASKREGGQQFDQKRPVTAKQSARKLPGVTQHRKISSGAQAMVNPRREDSQSRAAEKRRFRTMDMKNRDLFHQAKRDYDSGRYSEAKVKFVALEQQAGYSKASRNYIDTIDRRVLKYQGKALVVQKQEREGYLKGRTDRERLSFEAKEAGLKTALEDRAKARAFSQQGISAYPRVRNEYTDSLNLRARRSVEPQVISEQQVLNMKEIAPVEENAAEVTPKESIDLPEEPQPPVLSPNEGASLRQRRKQKTLSDKRKKYFEEQYKAAQKEKDEQALKEKQEQELKEKQELAKQEAQEQKLQELSRPQAEPRPPAVDKVTRRLRERELKHRALYEHELRRTGSVGLERAMAAADAQDKKDENIAIRRQQEVLRQQREEEKSERRDKERQITTMMSQGQDIEGAPKTDIKALRVTKAKTTTKAPQPVDPVRPKAEGVKIEKEEMRQQFESGVDEMYREALSYYKSGMYKEARAKLSDVDDLSPDYKRTRTYLERTDQEILKEQKRRVKVKDTLPSLPQTSRSKALSSVPSVGKKDAVSSALDMFEAQEK